MKNHTPISESRLHAGNYKSPLDAQIRGKRVYNGTKNTTSGLISGGYGRDRLSKLDTNYKPYSKHCIKQYQPLSNSIQN